jgi:exodeoxyribonuclease V
MKIRLDKHQRHAFEKFTDWYETADRPQIFRLFGYAGTGKTTLATYIA